MSGDGWWRDGAADLGGALARPWLWTALGRHDLRQRYFGSTLGTFWSTASVVLMVGTLVLVFGDRLGAARGFLAAYIAIGLVLWQFIQGTLNEACYILVGAADTIRNGAMPLSVQFLRLVWRNLIILAHTAVTIPIVLLAAGIAPSVWSWSVVPALALLALALFAATALLGLLGARFRDLPQITAYATQLLFFLTPIFWLPSALIPGHAWLVRLNPVFAFIDIVRAPLLGGVAAETSWLVASAATLAAMLGAFAALATMRRSIAFWI